MSGGPRNRARKPKQQRRTVSVRICAVWPLAAARRLRTSFTASLALPSPAPAVRARRAPASGTPKAQTTHAMSSWRMLSTRSMFSSQLGSRSASPVAVSAGPRPRHGKAIHARKREKRARAPSTVANLPMK